MHILRRAVRKLQLPALRVLLQPARYAHSDPYATTAYAYTNTDLPAAYAHPYPHYNHHPYAVSTYPYGSPA